MAPPKPAPHMNQPSSESLANLSLRLADDAVLVDLERSFGPILCLVGGRFVFDARKKEVPQIGFNASPLFGVAHRYANWVDERSNRDGEALRSAYQRLIDRKQLDRKPSGNPAECHRQYVLDSLIDQYPEQQVRVGKSIAQRVPDLAEIHSDLIQSHGHHSMSFWLQFADESMAKDLANRAVAYGLLLEREKDQLQFWLHMGYRDAHLAIFWQQLEHLLAGDTAHPLEMMMDPKVESNFRFHRQLLQEKLGYRSSDGSGPLSAAQFLSEEIDRNELAGLTVQEISPENYAQFRQQILDMQSLVYEPARQTPAEEFDSLFNPEHLRHQTESSVIEREPLGLAVLQGDQIVAMAFAGPLDRFTCERGVSEDPFLNDPMTYYMVDLTVVEAHRGRLGRLMKNALTLLAMQKHADAVHGRNRDRWARGMWAINLSLGSYEIQHLANDYPDDDEFRDCIYYRCPMRWESRPVQTDWSSGIRNPLSGLHLPYTYLRDRIPEMVNGMVGVSALTVPFLKELSYIARYWPTEIRNVLATCQPDHAWDQALQAIRRRGEENRPIVAIRGGMGESLTDQSVQWIDHPKGVGKVQYLSQLEMAISNPEQPCQAVFVEPVCQKTHDIISEELLEKTVKLCRNRRVPLIYDDSAAMLYRHGDWFAPSCQSHLTPDLVIASLGHELTILLGRRSLHPGPMIQAHTNSMNLFGFAELLRQIHRNLDEYQETLAQFDQTMTRLASGNRIQINHGLGWIEGELAAPLQGRLLHNGSRYLVCPSWIQMRRINNDLRSE